MKKIFITLALFVLAVVLNSSFSFAISDSDSKVININQINPEQHEKKISIPDKIDSDEDAIEQYDHGEQTIQYEQKRSIADETASIVLEQYEEKQAFQYDHKMSIPDKKISIPDKIDPEGIPTHPLENLDLKEYAEKLPTEEEETPSEEETPPEGESEEVVVAVPEEIAFLSTSEIKDGSVWKDWVDTAHFLNEAIARIKVSWYVDTTTTPASFEGGERYYLASVRVDFRYDFIEGVYYVALSTSDVVCDSLSYLEIKNISTGEIVTGTTGANQLISPFFAPFYVDADNSHVTFAIRVMGDGAGCSGTVEGVYLYQVE